MVQAMFFIMFILMYLFFNRNKYHFIFRVIASILIFLLTITLIIQYNSFHRFNIYSSKNLITIIENNKGKKLVYICDRRPKAINAIDYRLLNYLKSINEKLVLIIDGNIGSRTCDELKKIKDLTIIYSNHQFQEEIQNYFGLKTKLSQITENKQYEY